MLNKYYLYLKYIFKFKELNSLNSTDVILMSHDFDLGFTYNKMKYATILDSLNYFLRSESISTLSIALPFSNYVKKSTFSNSFSVNGLIIRALIFEKLKVFLRISPKIHNNQIIKAWKKIISKTNVKIIIAIQPPIELCFASQMMNVIICDYQHGVLSNEGYYGLNYRRVYNNGGWPTYILCWDINSRNWIKNNIHEKVKAIVLGNPLIIRFSEKNIEDYFILDISQQLRLESSKIPTILVSLNWGFDLMVDEVNEIGMNLELFNYIKKNIFNCNWFVRIHPVLMKNNSYIRKVKKTFENFKNVEWKHSSSYPLPIVLANTDLHITSHSAVTLDAVNYGVITALLHKNKKLLLEYFSDQIHSGIAQIVEPNELNIHHWIINNINNNSVKLEVNQSSKKIVSFFKTLLN